MLVFLIEIICIGFCIDFFFVNVCLKTAENRLINIIKMGVEMYKKRS